MIQRNIEKHNLLSSDPLTDEEEGVATSTRPTRHELFVKHQLTSLMDPIGEILHNVVPDNFTDAMEECHEFIEKMKRFTR